MSITLVINTLNEERNILSAIKSVGKFADEVVVVDMQSDDKTQELARSAGAKVYGFKRLEYVEPARNFALEKATNDYVLLLDADETIEQSLKDKLNELISTNQCDYLRIPRKNIIFEKWVNHTNFWPDYNIRFFKRGYVSWQNEIHSIPITKGKGMDLPAEEKYAITHNHYRSIEDFVSRMNRYTNIQSKERYKRKGFILDSMTKMPTSEFVSRYFANEGYKDNIHGLALSLLQSFSEALVALKMWELNEFKPSKVDSMKLISMVQSSLKEISYWKANTEMQLGSSIVARVKRKLRIP